MKQHDEHTLIKEALAQAAGELAHFGHVRPGAFMLVRNNPQTGVPLAQPTAIGTLLEETPLTDTALEGFLQGVRDEARRLDAKAVALSAEAEAELEQDGQAGFQRVLLVRMEDEEGVHLMHAPIEPQADGGMALGELVASPDAEGAEGFGPPLLARTPE